MRISVPGRWMVASRRGQRTGGGERLRSWRSGPRDALVGEPFFGGRVGALRHHVVAPGECARALLAASAEDDDVVVAHSGGSAPVCSASMNAAYQAGQSSSRSPV